MPAKTIENPDRWRRWPHPSQCSRSDAGWPVFNG
jgi:hypothetical protein